MKKGIQVNNILDGVKIYVGTYAKYNNGSIFGKWLTLGEYSDLSEFYDACMELHKDEDDPEFMFQDFEAPDLFKNSIWEGGIDEDIFEIAEAMEDKDIDMVSAYVSLMGKKLTPELIEQAEQSFYGHFDSYTDLAEDYAEQTAMLNEVPESIQRYFDFEAFGRDLSYDFMDENGYYFNNN